MTELLKRTITGGIVLCGRKTCCPVLERVDSDHVSITDDEGGKVTLQIEQAKLLSRALDELEK